MALDTQSDFTQVALEMSNGEPLIEEGGYSFYGWISRLSDRKELGIFKDNICGNGVMWDVSTTKEVSDGEKRVTMFDKNQDTMVRISSRALRLRHKL